MWSQKFKGDNTLEEALAGIHKQVMECKQSRQQQKIDMIDDQPKGKTQQQSSPFLNSSEFIEFYNEKFGEAADVLVAQQLMPQKHATTESRKYVLEDEYVEKLKAMEAIAIGVVNNVDTIVQELSNLEITNLATTNTLQNLHYSCERLSSEHSRLSKIAERIQRPLVYFDDLVRISSTVQGQILNRQLHVAELGDTRVAKLMNNIAKRIHECLTFLGEHPSFQDAASFAAKYAAIETKLVNAMKQKVQNIFDQAVSKIQNEISLIIPSSKPNSKKNLSTGLDIAARQQNENIAAKITSFYYIKFVSYASPAHALIRTFEERGADVMPINLDHSRSKTQIRRNQPISNIYTETLSDVQEHYCSLRLSLVVGPFRDRLRQIISTSSAKTLQENTLISYSSAHASNSSHQSHNLLAMVGAGLAALDEVCEREAHHFYQHFFCASVDPKILGRCIRSRETLTSKSEYDNASVVVNKNSSLWNMLLFLGDVLYGNLRAKLIKENDVFKLCGVIDMLDVAESPSSIDGVSRTVQSVHQSYVNCVNVARLKLQRDTQERLSYRAEEFVRVHIRGFHVSKSAEHNAYITLLGKRNPNNQPPFAGHDGKVEVRNFKQFHPLLRDICTFLERIYKCVDMPIFQSISQQSVQLCCSSLLDIAEAVDKLNRDQYPLRAPLLALSHFMALRSLISKFDIQCTVTKRTLNFKQTRTAIGQLLGSGRSLFTWGSDNAFVKLLRVGVPTIREEKQNIRDELEAHLQTARQQYIVRGTDQVLKGLRVGDANSVDVLRLNTVTMLESTVSADLQSIRTEVEDHFPDDSAREVILNPLMHAIVRQLATLKDECTAAEKMDIAVALDTLLSMIKGTVAGTFVVTSSPQYPPPKHEDKSFTQLSNSDVPEFTANIQAQVPKEVAAHSSKIKVAAPSITKESVASTTTNNVTTEHYPTVK